MPYLRRRLKPENRTPKRQRVEGPSPEQLEHARALLLERRARITPPPTLHKAVMSGSTSGQAVPKEDPLQHEGYIRLVRTFACEHCGRTGPSEFAHADTGKGGGIKSDCRMGTSLCGYRSPEDPGCHWLIGTKRIYPKAQRRELEAQMSARTRAKARALGRWPKNLPPWPEDA